MNRIIVVGSRRATGMAAADLAATSAGVRDVDGVDEATAILRQDPAVALVILLVRSSDLAALGAIGRLSRIAENARVLAVFEDNTPRDALRDELATLLADHAPPAVQDAPERYAPTSAAPPSPDALQRFSERQRDVLYLIREGCSNKRIALMLDISEATVKIHCSTLFRALGVRNRTQAALLAEGLPLGSPGAFRGDVPRCSGVARPAR